MGLQVHFCFGYRRNALFNVVFEKEVLSLGVYVAHLCRGQLVLHLRKHEIPFRLGNSQLVEIVIGTFEKNLPLFCSGWENFEVGGRHVVCCRDELCCSDSLPFEGAQLFFGRLEVLRCEVLTVQLLEDCNYEIHPLACVHVEDERFEKGLTQRLTLVFRIQSLHDGGHLLMVLHILTPCARLPDVIVAVCFFLGQRRVPANTPHDG
mmetsp:Transcript_29862/g.50171  ORF Transcript_29862/g.50171 Transcript_29862/m.50171 type:complete len:206 (+) Transcript_29862:1580-2197(+)